MKDMKTIVSECYSCANPRCETGCPTGNRIRSFIYAMKQDSLQEAGEILYEVNPFPELTSRLCDCNRQCRGHCIRGIKQEAVRIPEVERYISEHVKRNIHSAQPCGLRVAVIGSGPAALAACVTLIENGVEVHVFEKDGQAGGAIYSGIPAYRFDHGYVEQIQKDLEMAGVQFHFHTTVDSKYFEQLREDFDSVLVCVGAQSENTAGLSGEGCLGGLSLLRALNVEGKAEEIRSKYHGAVVWGGGNVAMDCARSLKRILPEVTVIYRRSEKEMPANKEEYEEALEEGVRFAFLETIKTLECDEQGAIRKAECVRMELGEPDESGRRRPVEIKGSAYKIDCELVVCAIGQKVDLSVLSPELGCGNAHETTLEHVYVAGDARLGPATVAAAIHDGKEAAACIIEAGRR